jgi:hypothetical protein
MKVSNEDNTLTFTQFAHQKLKALAIVTNDEQNWPRMTEALAPLMHQWGSQLIGNEPKAFSDIVGDQFPLEFSVNFYEGSATVRMLLEAQTYPRTLLSNWHLAMKICDLIGEKTNATFAHLNTIKDLYKPGENSNSSFSVWFAVDFNATRQINYKIYLNPQINGLEHSKPLVQQTMQRLGLAQSWQLLNDKWFSFRPQDTIKYLSVDLCDSLDPRIKVYIEHKDAHADDLDQIFRREFDVTTFSIKTKCQKMGLEDGHIHGQSALTCFSFTPKSMLEPGIHFQFPILAYADSDKTALKQLATMKHVTPNESSLLLDVLNVLRKRSLDESAMQTWFAFKNIQRECRDFTVYVSTETYL